MAGIEDGIKKVLDYAADDTKGYELHSRDYSVGTDCAGLVRMYCAAVEGVDVSSYPGFGTWSEKATLTKRGWTAYGFKYSWMQRGDVLLRAKGDATGHTVVYLGGGRIVGAEGNKDGKRGDSSGREICEKAYYDYDYDWILRPPASAGATMQVTDKVAEVKGAVYRLYNRSGGDHLLTSSHREAQFAADSGWKYEGVAFKVGGDTNVLRLYNPNAGQHFYTTSTSERDELKKAGWTDEGIAFRVGGDSDVYRLYNPNSGQHVYTASVKEYDSLKDSGWTDEGVAWKAKI